MRQIHCHRDLLRIKDYVGFIPNPGDVAVWTVGYNGGKYGHVGVVISANESTLTVADVYGSESGSANQIVHSTTYAYNGSGMLFWGIIRPNFSSTSIEYAAITPAKYRIRNSNGTYLTAKNNWDEERLTGREALGTNTQVFNVKKDNGSYSLRAMISSNGEGRAVNVYTTSSSANGDKVTLWEYTGDNSQLWKFEKKDDGYIIRPADTTSLALTLDSDSNVSVRTYTGAASQIWYLEDTSHFTVTFDAGDGEVDVASKTVVSGEEYGELPIPRRSGYDFLYWMTEDEIAISENSIFSFEKNQTLYAFWNEKKVNKVSLGTEDIEMVVGGTHQLTAEVYPEDALDRSVTYFVVDDTIATVSENGMITAVATGETIAHAVSSNGIIGSITVKIFESNDEVFSEWKNSLPDGVTEENYIIEEKTQYRYRDNTVNVTYGEWSSEKSTSSKPVESDTLTITSTTKYYNYYHWCGSEIDSIYNEGTSYTKHTYKSTTKLGAVGSPSEDRGGKQPYGGTQSGVNCAYNWYYWFEASPFETYTYKYKTREATEETVEGVWTQWSTEIPETAENREIEEETLYRYKAKVIEEVNGAKLTIGSVTAKAGMEVVVPFTITDNPGIAGYNLTIEFDKSKLSPVSIEKGSDFTQGTLTSNIQQGGDMESYDVINAYWVNPANVNANGNMLNVKFKVKDGVEECEIPINASYVPGDVSDQNYNDVALSITNGKIVVENVVVGDVKCDGIVNTKDGIRLSQYLAGWEVALTSYEIKAADLVCDGIINTKDGIKLAQHLAAWDIELSEINLMGTGNVAFEVGSVTAKAGSEVEVPIYITETSGIAGFNVMVEYDKNKLEPVSIVQGEALSAGTLTSNIHQGGDMERFDAVSAYWVNPYNLTTNGIAFTVKFKVKEGAEGEIGVSLTYDEYDKPSDQVYNDLEVSIVNGKIVVESENVENYDYVINSVTGDIPQSGSFYAEVDVTKLTDRDAVDVIVIAAYKDGIMISKTYMKSKFEMGQNVIFGGMLTAIEGCELKAFVWDGLNTMKPLAESR